MAATLPVLTFHSLDHRESAISYSPAAFRHVINKLLARGYQTLKLTEAAEYLRRNVAFPNRSCVLTFDDGYENVYTEAFPILEQHGLQATVFIAIGGNSNIQADARLNSMNSLSMLSWGQIREMRHAGIDFGAHTLTHPDLTSLPPDRAELEIIQSRSVIEDALGTNVECFAYPYGRHNRHSREITRQHFTCAVSDRLGVVCARSNLFALERIDAAYLRSNRSINFLFTPIGAPYIWARSLEYRVTRQIRANPASQ